jgi:hypothetical protein
MDVGRQGEDSGEPDAVNKLVRAFESWCAEVEVGVQAATAAGGFAPDIARELPAMPDRATTAVPA